jgi:putative heme-binding domain-containing protein
MLRILIPVFLLISCHAIAAWEPAEVPTVKPLTDNVKPRWFRCFVQVPDNMVTPQEKDLWRDSMTFSMAGVEAPFAIYLNGQKIADSEPLPGDKRRRFKVPKGILEKSVFNVFAIQVNAPARGISAAPILAGYFDELSLTGKWETNSDEPAPSDLKPTKDRTAANGFMADAFRPATSPLAANLETIPGDRLSPSESLAKMKTPDDLAVDLLLNEPLVAQPTHLSFDERGRMWVSQYRQYPFPAGLQMVSRDRYYRARFDKVPPAPPNHDPGQDIISVHEDTNGDGIFDKHKVVLQGLNMANSAVRGHGGIWVMHTPYLLFYPDKDGDDIPDAAPEVRLAGFGLEDTHSVANGLVWGPDGWLYGGQGSTTTSRVVRPGVDPPDFAGVYHENCMIWRYHPERKIYEIFAEGGGNIFGLEFDAEGRLYSGHNGGDTRGWHYVQSGLFLKQGIDPGKFGPQGHPFAFGYLEAMKSRNPIARFSHSTIVAEGTAIPERLQGRIVAADPLHRNVIIAERYPRGSSFETSDSGKALEGADPAFRPVFMANAPDGSIYLADFYEEYIAHGQNYQGQIDPSTGRIYRIRSKSGALRTDVNLSEKTPAELVTLLAHPNRWHRHTAVRLLAERNDKTIVPALKNALSSADQHPALEALWALHQLGALDSALAIEALKHPQAAVRAWTIRLMGDARELPSDFAAAVNAEISGEADPEVRAQVASTAARLKVEQAIPLITALTKLDKDSADPYIPLLCWWAIERHCTDGRDSVLSQLDWDSSLAKEHILPRIMRRFASSGSRTDLLTCAQLLEKAPDDLRRRALMTGFEAAFSGRSLTSLPELLLAALDKFQLASPLLRVRLKDPAAIATALKVMEDPKEKPEQRLLTARLFGEVTVPDAVAPLLRIVSLEKSVELRKAALTSLIAYENAEIGEQISRAFPNLPAEVQPAAITLLTSRPGWSRALLLSVQQGAVPRAAIPDQTVTLLREHADKSVAQLATELYTPAKATSSAAIAQERERIRTVLANGPGDPYRGEPLFMQRCSACHLLFHKGGKIGPDLTAYQRDDLGTLLTSVLDPNAEIREGFVNQIVATKDGRTLSGFLADQDNSVVVFRGLDVQDVSINRDQIRELRRAAASIMPEGLLAGLTDQQIRDFFAYLRIPQPITP